MLVTSTEFDLDYKALTEGVGFARLERSLIELTGADRASFLHNLCTNEIKKLAPGSGCEAFVLNAQGKILGFANVFVEAERILLDTVAGQNEFLLKHLDRYLIQEKVVLTDRTAESAVILVAGQKAGELLQSLGGQPVPAGLLEYRATEFAGCAATVARVDFTGVECFFIRCQQSDRLKIAMEIVSAGGRDCESDAIEALRIEHGTPQFGIDIGEKNLPQELGRDQRSISFIKGCYIGQETVARIDALGHVNRLLCGVRLDATFQPKNGDAIQSDGQTVGEITSVSWSPKLNAPLALAYIKRAKSEPGQKLTCGDLPAEIVKLPIR